MPPDVDAARLPVEQAHLCEREGRWGEAAALLERAYRRDRGRPVARRRLDVLPAALALPRPPEVGAQRVCGDRRGALGLDCTQLRRLLAHHGVAARVPDT